ncbi:MAG: hypothetical protein QUV05_16310, partial [Phycisphaerae bacterium]|nr:hypothetical protein [Phycisphaerae bacterium]
MARPLRIEFSGALYHVMSRGNDRRAIVRDDADRNWRLAWGMDVDFLLGADPPTVWTLAQDLTVINGPIATPAVD